MRQSARVTVALSYQRTHGSTEPAGQQPKLGGLAAETQQPSSNAMTKSA